MRALIPGVPILFQWVPRKVNGKADRLTHNAREAHKSNIDLPEALLNSLLVPSSRVDRQTVPAESPSPWGESAGWHDWYDSAGWRDWYWDYRL